MTNGLPPFSKIEARAEARHGGEAGLAARLSETGKSLGGAKSRAALRRLGEDRYLSVMTKCVFQSGFRWKLVEDKWDAFETAFRGFDPRRCASLSDDEVDRLLKNDSIIRHGAKIVSVRGNAQFVLDLAAEHGSAARFFADWPGDDLVGLVFLLRKRAVRLGGMTAFNFLRQVGKDTFMPWRDVVAGLTDAGVIDGELATKRDLLAAQAAFNRWAEDTGHSLTRLSQTLALSIGPIGGEDHHVIPNKHLEKAHA